ncbi:MAG: hypothetical protein AAGF12_09915 [Myxococcota bacterium]
MRGVAVVLAGVVLSAVGLIAPSAEAQEATSPTRFLRRVTLLLLDRPPTMAEYEALLAEPEEQRGAAVDRFIASTLESAGFRETLRSWGHEFIGTAGYLGPGGNGGYFGETQAISLDTCPDDSVNAGKRAFVNDGYPQFGNQGICDDPNAFEAEIEPWWAPGTTVTVLGDVATEARVGAEGQDCGLHDGGLYKNHRAGLGCSCGPNLVYCGRRTVAIAAFGEGEGYYTDPTSIRRGVFEEPARLFEHIVAEDRPFSDLVLGNYTVVNQGLHHLYVRMARNNSQNASLDDVEWWRDYQADPHAWREKTFQEMHPNLLDDRNYHFDPRVEMGEPLGVPSAGVLTMVAGNHNYPRERVRASRWLETFACREFAPPPSSATFPAYTNDPATGGACMHCHASLIDPAAIHFKRFFHNGLYLGGIGPKWDLRNMNYYYFDYFEPHTEVNMVPGTVMTPISEALGMENPNARLIDFMPEGTTLFGLESDGTIGPLGFAKLMVDSGEFDRCTVRKTYRRFGRRDLVPGVDDVAIDELTARFVGENRSMRRLIAAILEREQARLGY